MTHPALGWIHIKGEKTAYTNYEKKMKDDELEQWPPKFWKFHVSTAGDAPVEVAFTDARRFGRVRLVDCLGDDIRKHSPLVENGPDPVVDKDIFTHNYLRKKMKSRHVPIKALLLDQTTISGIGNWVADETLYQSRLHPEQYCDEFGDDEIKKLYEAIRDVCQTAVDKLADSDEFPDHWLFKYRWGKGAKGATSKLPNGEKLAFITVGGRTSCYAPGLQKKTGNVVPGAKGNIVKSEQDDNDEVKRPSKKPRISKSSREDVKDERPPIKKQRIAKFKKEEEEEQSVKKEEQTVPATLLGTQAEDGRRRSGRLRK